MPATPDLFTFDNRYARELGDFCVRWQPTPAPQPALCCLNRELAAELGVDPDALAAPDGLAVLAGKRVPAGAEPVAQAYAGHQFGGFSPQLGDGRALLLGEVIDRNGQRRDIAFKGSGRTPFSRNGDGKCALGPALREFLVSEAMHALGIPTTRVLAVVATGETVRRERALPGAILTRVAASHVRVGTFEFLAAHRGPQAVQRLAEHVIDRHYPELAGAANPYGELLRAVAARQAALVARWLGAGFIHGVMNTDNMAISGETIDYGPCAFIETYDPDTVFSSIDHQGRYAYGRQAEIAQWNLARFAETLLPLLADDERQAVALATEIIEEFPAMHAAEWLAVFRTKLGLDTRGDEAGDRALAADFLALLQTGQHDFTQAFRALYAHAAGTGPAPFTDDAGQAWLLRWQQRQPQRTAQQLAAMRLADPACIARNHLVENALADAVDRKDFTAFQRLLAALRTPAELRPEDAALAAPAPREFTAGYLTFCGT